jgi:uncharacterized protein YneF (UPF0154 family)
MQAPYAIRVLILGGVLNLVLSFVLGWVLSMKRMKEPMAKHHWLWSRTPCRCRRA